MTMKTWVIIGTLLLALLVADKALAGEHRVYTGPTWLHFSNLDAGFPFNDDAENHADHFGWAVEYQYVVEDGHHFYLSGSLGRNQMTNVEGYSGWDCSGCKAPAAITMGFKWRLF